MIDKLEWNNNAFELMKYIGIIEDIYMPDFDNYEYRINVSLCEASKEAIKEASNRIFGTTDCMIIFKDRYNKRLLTIQHLYDKYLKEREIQNLLQYLEVDVDKFWLLLLFAFDYCENMFYQGITMKLNPIEQIEQLVAMIDKSADDTMTLNFKAGKLKAEIDDTRAIRFIVDAIKKYANEADIEILKHLSRRIKADESEILKESPFIAFFANMLLCFFNMQPQIRNKRKAGTKHSLKEMELVSFLIYFTRISTNEKWLDIENEYLKAYLKQYKDYNYPNNTNNVYPEFTT